MNTILIFRCICIAVVIAMLIYYTKRKNNILSALTGSITGFLALTLINRYGALFDINLHLNAFNTIGSALLGIPFVLCLIILKQI